jgi:ankyrin repeat protein
LSFENAVEPIQTNEEPTDPNDTIQSRSFAEASSPDLIRECLRSLAFHEMDARLHGIERADKDTCEWIFETTQFRNWESRVDIVSHNGVMWIKGKPGSGKSTLMKRIWQRLRKEANNSILAAFFFHGRGNNPIERSALGMLRSILYQLLDQSSQLCAAFLPIFLDKKKKHGNDIPWYFGELKSFLASSAGNLRSNRVWLLVDALDECAIEEVQSVVSILESLACSAIESHTALNICLASRHYPQIRMSKADELVVEAQCEHGQDIREYVRNNLIVNDPKIEAEILRKSAHVFLWVELVVKMLNKASDNGRVRAMRQILCNVPDDLDDLYRALLTEGRNPGELRESVYMLQWVLFAKEDLRPEELYFAVLSGTDPDNLEPWDQQKDQSSTIQRFITSTSRSLIEIVNIKESIFDFPPFKRRKGRAVKVQFIHESVRDFLLSVKGLQLLDSSLKQLVGNSHGRLARCCYSYIMMKSLKSVEEQTAEHEKEIWGWGWSRAKEELEQLYPFLSYAGEFILKHIEVAEMGGVSQLELLKKLQPGSNGIQRLRHSKKIFGAGYGRWASGPEVMHAAAEMGLYEIVRRSLEEIKVNVDVVGGHYGTTLQAAAEGGHEKIVELLLEHKANVNTIGGRHGTALQAAAEGGHEKIVQLLLEHKAGVNTISGHYGTALHATAEGGHEKIVQLLLEHGADVNTIDGFLGTALHATAKGGHEKIVQLLLDHGADVNITGGNYCTALHVAVLGYREPIARILLKHGADVNARDGSWGTALHTARRRTENQACIDLLLEYEAEDHPPIEEISELETDSAVAVSVEPEAELD